MNTGSMTEITIKAGTVVHLKGVPVELPNDTQIRLNSENKQLIVEESSKFKG